MRRDVPKGLIRFTLLAVLFLILGPTAGFAGECTDGRVELGARLYDEGKFEKAVQDLKNYTKKSQAGPKAQAREECLFEANLYIGMAYLGMGREKEAKEYIRNAVKVAGCKPLNLDVPPKVTSLYDEACALIPVAKSKISVTSNVTGAEVYVDDVGVGRPPLEIPDFAPGSRLVKVLYGNQKREETFLVEPGKAYEFRADFQTSGNISVTSEPDGAEIYLDGTLLGTRTPSILKDCSAGEHTLRVVKGGFLEETRTVTIKANDVVNVAVSLKKIVYSVKVDSEPRGAEVFWDGEKKGATPLVIEGVTPGTHKIAVAKEDYESQGETINVENVLTERTYRLGEYMGTVEVTTDPPGAEVFINDKYVGVTPFQGKYPPKTYSLGLNKTGFKEKKLSFTITRDKSPQLHEKLMIIDTQPPEIVIEPIERTIKENQYHIRAVATDNQGMGNVSLLFREEGERNFQKLRMAGVGKDMFAVAIPDLYLKKDKIIEYYVVACDAQNNCAESGHKDTPYKVRVISREPYTEGYILDIDKEKRVVTISLGSLDSIAKEDRMYVFRLGQRYTDPKTGDVLTIAEELAGVIKVTDLMPSTAFAVITDEFSGVPPIAKNDRIRKRAGPPTGVGTEGNYANKILIRWVPNKEPEVKGYVIYRSLSPTGEPEKLDEVSGRDNTGYEDTKGMREGLTYHYRVAALNKLGTLGVLSKSFEGKTKKGVRPPERLKAEHGTFREMLLTWDVSGRDPDIDSYFIYRSTSEDGEFTQINQVGRDTNSYADKSYLLDGKTYYYKVAGKSIYGSTGDFSVVASGKTRGGPLPAQKIRVQNNMVKTVKLEWESLGSEDDGLGYIIWRKENEDGELSVLTKTKEPVYYDEMLKDGMKYYYCIQGYYRYKGIDIKGECSRTVTGETKAKPKIPSGFSAQGGLAKRIRIQWEKTTDKNVREYWIHRKKGPKSTSALGSFFEEVMKNINLNRIRVNADANEYVDTGLDTDAIYTYVIKAVDNDKLESEFSSEVSARTKAAPAAPSGVKISTVGNQTVLSWEPNKEPDVVAYKVYRKAMFPSHEFVATTSTTSYEVALREGSKMELLVTAVDKDELESEFSSPVGVETKN